MGLSHSLAVGLFFLASAAGQNINPSFAGADLVAKPDFFPTLVNPTCSHCVDEARRRAGELRDQDRVLAWIRGKYNGGAVPLRFFLARYRVISDTYGVWVYDADAGYLRGYAPSLDFRFYGWRNGVVVIQHKDGTLFSALSGRAFAGPREGAQLEPLPTLATDWGYWLKAYPKTVAYHMFPKYAAQPLPDSPAPDSVATRPKADPRLPAETEVIGLALDRQARAYPISLLQRHPVIRDRLGSREFFVLWFAPTRTAAIYAAQLDDARPGDPDSLDLEFNPQIARAPFMDKETFSHWGIEGRAVEGPLAGKTIRWLPGVQCRWFAWAAEYPNTSIYAPAKKEVRAAPRPALARLIQGQRLNWDQLIKGRGTFLSFNRSEDRVVVRADSDHAEHELAVSPDSEILREGSWGTLSEFEPNDRVFFIVHPDGKGRWSALHAMADEISMQFISRPYRITRRPGPSERTSGKLANGAAASGGPPANDDQWVLADPKGRRPQLVCRTDDRTRFRISDGDRPAAGEEVYCEIQQDAAGFRLAAIVDRTALAQARAQRSLEQGLELRRFGLRGSLLEWDPAKSRAMALIRRADSGWARGISNGAPAELRIAGAEEAGVVSEVRPDYSRIRLTIDLQHPLPESVSLGSPVEVVAPLPDRESEDPPMDLGRFSERQDRIDYFLSTIYCPCGMIGSACAGHWNTLAACKIHGCGMPNIVTAFVERRIDSGQTDRQIYDALRQRFGDSISNLHRN